MKKPMPYFDRLAAPVVLAYWLMLLGGLGLFTASRAGEAATTVPLWIGVVAGTMLGQCMALRDFRLWLTIAIVGGAAMWGFLAGPDGLDGKHFWMAFVPAAVCGALSLADRWSLLAFWFPVVIWMLSILDRNAGSTRLDVAGGVLLGVLAVAFIGFLYTRESRRVGLWRVVATAPLAPTTTPALLRESPGRQLGRAAWSIFIGALAFAFTAWIAPMLWRIEAVRGHTTIPGQANGGGVPGTGLPCCPVDNDADTTRSRVKEYFDLGRGHDELGDVHQTEQQCVRCDGPGGGGYEGTVAIGEPTLDWEHGTPIGGDIVVGGDIGGGVGGGGVGGGGVGGGVGGGGVGGGVGGAGGGGSIGTDIGETTAIPSTSYTPPPAYTPPPIDPPVNEPVPEYRPTPPPEPTPVPPVPPPVEYVPPPPVAPPVAESPPEVTPPVAAPSPAPSTPEPSAPSPPVAHQSSTISQQPAPSDGSSLLQWIVLIVAGGLAYQVLSLALRPLRRAITLRHLRQPFWSETVDQRVSNWWQLVLVGLRDAGWRTSAHEPPAELARRVGVDGVERCATILERTRHGIGIDADDLATMSTSAESAYQAGRRRVGAVARALAWLRWPLT